MTLIKIKLINNKDCKSFNVYGLAQRTQKKGVAVSTHQGRHPRDISQRHLLQKNIFEGKADILTDTLKDKKIGTWKKMLKMGEDDRHQHASMIKDQRYLNIYTSTAKSGQGV